MILTGLEIVNEVKAGRIEISPFAKGRVNPNSYNLTLNQKLLKYKSYELDMKAKPDVEEIIIPQEGLVLTPDTLYLGRTNELTFTDSYVPMLEGRSSIGRLGLFVHVSAGFGDVGFDGYWTLELHCVQPIKIYPNVEICQIYYHVPQGKLTYYGDKAKYNWNTDVQPSYLYKEFLNET